MKNVSSVERKIMSRQDAKAVGWFTSATLYVKNVILSGIALLVLITSAVVVGVLTVNG